MTIDEISWRKVKAQSDIELILKGLCTDTGCVVNDVHYHYETTWEEGTFLVEKILVEESHTVLIDLMIP